MSNIYYFTTNAEAYWSGFEVEFYGLWPNPGGETGNVGLEVLFVVDLVHDIS